MSIDIKNQKFNYRMMGGNFQTSCYIQNQSGDTIARILRDDAPSNKIQEANAAFIVTACNNHDKLIEALKETVDKIKNAARAEAFTWGASFDQANEFADEQTEKYTTILNEIEKETL